MEYDPAFPTEDNDEVDHIIDVTAIPLPSNSEKSSKLIDDASILVSTKKKSKRNSRLMKIPLPEAKLELSSKSLAQTSNSPPQEPDTSWLLPTSTQGPLKFNIMKSNPIKPPADEDNSIFDEIDNKSSEPISISAKVTPKLFPPKKSKPMALPTGVITKNADFVVNEPKTNTELFLPPKIVVTTMDGGVSAGHGGDISSTLAANSGTTGSVVASTTNQNMLMNNQYQLLNMNYIIPQKLRSAQMISQPLVANPAIASLSQKKAAQESSSLINKKRSSKSKSRSPKTDPETSGETQEQSKKSRSKSKDIHGKILPTNDNKDDKLSQASSETHGKWSNEAQKTRRRSRSTSTAKQPASDQSPSKARPRPSRRSPNTRSRRKSSVDSRNRRSHSPHRTLTSSRNRSRSRNRNRSSQKQPNRRRRSRSRKRSGSGNHRSRNRDRRSKSPICRDWLCDSNDDVQTHTKDCWAIESDADSTSEICDKIDSKSLVDKEAIEEKIIVSSSNADHSCLKLDKNEDAIVSSTVDETVPSGEYTTDFSNEITKSPSSHEQKETRKAESTTLNHETEKSRSLSPRKISGTDIISKTPDRESRSSNYMDNVKNNFDWPSPSNRSPVKLKSRSRSRARVDKTTKEVDRQRNLYNDKRIDRQQNDSRRRSRSDSKNRKYSCNKTRNRLSRNRSNSSNNEGNKKVYKQRHRSVSSHSETRTRKDRVAERSKNRRHQDSNSSVDSRDGRHRRSQHQARRDEGKCGNRVDNYPRLDSPGANREKPKRNNNNCTSSRGMQRRQYSSYDSRDDHDYQMRNRKSVKDNETRKRSKRRSHSTHSVQRNERSRNNRRLKPKPLASESLSNSESPTRFSYADSRKIEDSRKNKKYKSKKKSSSVRKAKDSESSSMNSSKIPASYQAAKKNTRKEVSTSDSGRSSVSIERKHKSKKVRKI